MNSQKLFSLILGVFTAAGALSLSSARSTNHQQIKGASVQEVADGSGPVPPPIQPRSVLLADGSGPIPPPIQPQPSFNFLAV